MITITSPDPFRGILCVRTIMQTPREFCQLSLQRTGGDHKDAEHHTAGSEIPQSHTAWSNG